MFIVGTAGHVDHGKTALVKALTGTDTDRLPEEKRRGLTIELGFALLDGPFPVGIIDVPGHERFIRNMVSGTWSLHCALLVIAADDGWMRQTTDHAHVLKGMGTPAVIVVITKTDIAGPERISIVRDTALLRCSELFGYIPECVEVSAHTLAGITECREAVYRSLKKPDTRIFPSCLYIDRSFTIQGAGTVATGSLVGDALHLGDQAVLLPDGTPVKIRSLQSHNRTVDSVSPAARTAVTLQGVKVESLQKGTCLTLSPGEFFTKNTFIAAVHGIQEDDVPKLRNHQEAEILYGTCHDRCMVHVIRSEGRVLSASIVCRKQPALFWGQRFILLRPGGSDILAWGQVLWGGTITPAEKQEISKLVTFHKGIPREISSYALLRLAVRGYAFMKQPVGDSLLFLDRQYLRVLSWYIESSILERLTEAILSLISRPGGASRQEILGVVDVSGPCARDVLEYLAETGKIERNQSVYRSAGVKKIHSPAVSAFLGRIEAEGIRGLGVKQVGTHEREYLGVLVREGDALILERTIIYSTRTYRQITENILKGRNKGELFSIADAKKQVGLSRKYMIPLLNRMESDGLVMRVGDSRKVI